MLAVRLPENLENELSLYAEMSDKTKTDVVKEALRLYLNTKEAEEVKTPYELGESFFGKYESGRDDLSTTYKQKLKKKLSEKQTTHR